MPFAAMGLSDSGLSLFRDDLPAGRWLIVRRDPAECLRSLLAMPEYPGVGKLDAAAAARVLGAMMDGLDAIEREQNARVVKYEALDDEMTMRSTWNHLIGDAQPWSDAHWQEMRHLRVVVRPETYEVASWLA